MKYQVIGRNIKVTQFLKESVELSLKRLEKYLVLDGVEARVVLSLVPDGQKVEVTIPSKVGNLRSEVTERNVYDAIEAVGDSLEEQLKRAKSRLTDKHHGAMKNAYVLDEIEDIDPTSLEHVRTKVIHPRIMDVDTAIANLELLGLNFYIYEDEYENKKCVVYKKDKETYGLFVIKD